MDGGVAVIEICWLTAPLPTVAAAEGLWPVVFATFVAYALLPLPTWFATLFGFLTACTHLLVVTFLPTALPSLAFLLTCAWLPESTR